MTPYEEGQQARNEGLGPEVCPFDDRDAQYDEWMDGYFEWDLQESGKYEQMAFINLVNNFGVQEAKMIMTWVLTIIGAVFFFSFGIITTGIFLSGRCEDCRRQQALREIQ